jgi:hypothetical protein
VNKTAVESLVQTGDFQERKRWEKHTSNNT